MIDIKPKLKLLQEKLRQHSSSISIEYKYFNDIESYTLNDINGWLESNTKWDNRQLKGIMTVANLMWEEVHK